MIFRCKDAACGCVIEGTEVPDCCPVCGGGMERTPESGLTGAQWTTLGIFWLERPEKNPERALHCFRRAAALGDATGISDLGWCMETGTGAKGDARQAVWLYEQAAGLGDIPAL